MENKQLSQKLNNISTMIQKQLIPPNQLYDNQKNILNPVPFNVQPTLQPQTQGSQQGINFQQLAFEQQRFKQDVGSLLNKIDRAQQSQTQRYQLSPQTNDPNRMSLPRPNSSSFGQSQPQFHYQTQPQTIQNSPISEQKLRQLKEENIELMKQAAQGNFLNQTCNELKQALNQSNNRLVELQKQLDQQIQANTKLKQEIIASEQEKINGKRSFEDYIANLQRQHNRETQQLQAQYNESLNVIESNLQQQIVLNKTESENNIQSLQNKLASLNNENRQLLENQSKVLNDFKQLQQIVETNEAELQYLAKALKDKEQEYDNLQKNYDQSLDKYEQNTKEMIKNHNIRITQYESLVQELKQKNNQLTNNIKQLEDKIEMDNENQNNQYTQKLNQEMNELQNRHLREQDQIQQVYENKIMQLNKEKDELYKQKQQQQLFLEQKISVLINENKNLSEEFIKHVEKNKKLEELNSKLEKNIQKLTNESHISQVHYSKQMQDLQNQIKNNNTKKQDVYEVNEKIQHLEQQLQYKKEELDLLLHHLDQVISINKEYETKVNSMKAQLETVNNKNNRENDAYFQQIKVQNLQITELSKKIDEQAQQIIDYEQAIKDLKIKNVSLEHKQQESTIKQLKQLKDDLQRVQEQNKSLQQKNTELEKKLFQSDNTAKTIQDQLDSLKRESLTKSDIISQFQSKNQSRLVNLEETLQNKILELKDAQTNCEQIEENNQQLQSQVEDYKSKVEELNQQIKKIKREKAQLSMQLMEAGMANLITSPLSSNYSEIQ